jgi:hypothetical protein
MQVFDELAAQFPQCLVKIVRRGERSIGDVKVVKSIYNNNRKMCPNPCIIYVEV